MYHKTKQNVDVRKMISKLYFPNIYCLDSPEFKKGLFTKVKGNDAVLSDYINEVRMNFNSYNKSNKRRNIRIII